MSPRAPDPNPPAQRQARRPHPVPTPAPPPASPTERHASSHAQRAGELPDAFDAFELAEVLSHYDLGVIESVRPFVKGSRRAPKLAIRAEKGRFLLKRRREGADDFDHLAFAHRVQIHLAGQGVPVPRFTGTRRHNSSVLRRAGRLYELFEFVKGDPYDGSETQTRAAGATLADLHSALTDLDLGWTPPEGGYHDASPILRSLDAISSRYPQTPHPPATPNAKPADLGAHLADAYQRAGAKADALGAPQWPKQTIHGDWHPGNLLFSDGAVAGILDFDSARPAPRVMDLANGALQFSLTRGGDDPKDWPEDLDFSRFIAFCNGYDGAERNRISTAELEALPWLMIEAIIVEAAVPVAATGSFALMEGGAFLQMVERKVTWLEQHADKLAHALDD